MKVISFEFFNGPSPTRVFVTLAPLNHTYNKPGDYIHSVRFSKPINTLGGDAYRELIRLIQNAVESTGEPENLAGETLPAVPGFGALQSVSKVDPTLRGPRGKLEALAKRFESKMSEREKSGVAKVFEGFREIFGGK
jgi:hypothetical protein